MRYVSFVAVFVATANAQLSHFPSCSQGCLLTNIQTSGCGLLDFKCVCAEADFIHIMSCLRGVCPATDVPTAVEALTDLCEQVGVSIQVPQPTEAKSQPIEAEPPPTANRDT